MYDWVFVTSCTHLHAMFGLAPLWEFPDSEGMIDFLTDVARGEATHEELIKSLERAPGYALPPLGALTRRTANIETFIRFMNATRTRGLGHPRIFFPRVV